ncbi:unnamed protein product [Ixodes pacificus]
MWRSHGSRDQARYPFGVPFTPAVLLVAAAAEQAVERELTARSSKKLSGDPTTSANPPRALRNPLSGDGQAPAWTAASPLRTQRPVFWTAELPSRVGVPDRAMERRRGVLAVAAAANVSARRRSPVRLQ